jgi:hypothetical protein
MEVQLNPPTSPLFTELVMWRIWAKALGEKASSCDRESDKVALIRTLFIVQAIIANIFLIANAIHHW